MTNYIQIDIIVPSIGCYAVDSIVNEYFATIHISLVDGCVGVTQEQIIGSGHFLLSANEWVSISKFF